MRSINPCKAARRAAPWARTVPTSSSPPRRRVQRAAVGSDVAVGTLAITGSLGIVGGTLAAALYVLERLKTEELGRKITRLQSELVDKGKEVAAAGREVAKAKEYTSENEMYRTRYAECTRDILKLERALELRDGQLESFMCIAQRQIAYLESQVRELQKGD
ncbi:hypothetical protein TSOC_002960 [Tetrabaena socialis]|uniref:Uncharacterized protein n=1 Tax=Tetrabaena socialis TaxID=47790 RepID=A0A2J8ACR5_9CHLO|nr:hypothetical protein TSOC_002960 [Tetrabaena socialis]|eukprot:PNH10308.1 hypothetical protein TSOC_002960 [Tetrabaena socialis]